MRLLHAFKDARRRRDELPYGSSAWDAADEDIQQLQRQIFDLSFDDVADGAAAHELANDDQRPGHGRANGHRPTDPDSELGEPEGPAAI